TGVLKHFTGLPIPAAGAFACSTVFMESTVYGEPMLSPLSLMVIVVVASYLMISNIRYHTFKGVRPTPAVLAIVAAIMFVMAYTAMKFGVVVMLCAGSWTFACLGLAEEVLFYRRRRREEQAEEDHEEHAI
ncbi:MAG: hypothetical protein WC889_19235, partial [Myxococcota bacterium]